MKINQKYLEIGLIVVILVIGICAYNFGYQPYNEKAEALNVEINSLNTRVNELNAKIERQPEYEKGIANSTDIINSVLKKYGPGNTMEKTIMMVVDMCNKTKCSVSNISFSQPTLVYASTAVNEDGTSRIKAYAGRANLSMSTTYEGYKRVTDYINNHPERMNIENFTLSYNQENGGLNASLVLNLYSIEDANHEYVAPVIENIEIGTTNIFRNMVVDEENPEEENGEEVVAE